MGPDLNLSAVCSEHVHSPLNLTRQEMFDPEFTQITPQPFDTYKYYKYLSVNTNSTVFSL